MHASIMYDYFSKSAKQSPTVYIHNIFDNKYLLKFYDGMCYMIPVPDGLASIHDGHGCTRWSFYV